jgi:hypothetical protein
MSALSEDQMDFLYQLFEHAETTPVEKGYDVYNDWCANFLADQKDRVGEYGNSTNFSPKQWEMLIKIAGYLEVELP